jgi:outer membrane protein OmpU
MKKFLLGTSALVGAVAFASAASAEPTVSVGGFLDFQAGFTDQDLDATGTVGGRETKFANDTEVNINVQGTADNGLTYGAVIELEADVTADTDGSGLNADKTFLFVESNAGRVELGSNIGAEDALKVDAATIARATGGIDGDWYRFATVGTGFIIRPDLPNAHARGAAEDATKITYYSPRFSGVQVGVSYTPDDGNVGTAAAFTTDTNGDNENVFGLGANYTGQFDQVGVQLSATGAFGESETAATEDLSSWALGTVLSFQGFSVAGSYGDWDDSGLPTGGSVDQNYWTLGAGYETGPFGVSLTYMDSEAGTSDFTNVSVGADYQLAPGLVPYVEVNFFELDPAGAALDNDGTVLLVGTELTF